MKKSRLLAIVLLIEAWLSGPVYAVPFLITVDTIPLSGQSGFIAFDFAAGSPVPGNSAVISSFNSDSTLGSFSQSGDVSGILVPGPLSLGDTQFFNEWLQSMSSFGTTLSYQLDLGSNTALGGSPDSFSFFLLDSHQIPFATSDPTQADALIAIDLNGSSTTPSVYTSSFATAGIQPINIIPEPSSLWLTVIALPLLWRKRRNVA
ncbi:MAG: hypothetical protein CO150_07710 [Nitrospirae bacterium CG_4_9_14_3_um_filter_53_35]|nr:MAG: hypothetical protein AUK29_06885 [Nitrospirae bacterium CG2_30_53_67]PIS36926.1 MAG: hypothetical protein COT35_08625 [Nitrospirae bacterium CG08_land_8_20_14_0_20_52_24]PIV84045.1 MAG: hypothetical protein COW52_07960 [Nitrospirae bacterium CG17_big_fil_post_rev_8_21_14_2_50_50_9]PIW84780.1 MAG: hypothetical protein COZ95_08005 [Nitrospirae bacterium CG_4_8_14_3_um_filter_50_41]PIX86420.1 MAG: hypothetical protein COZ32_03395 [Nitrospirae bacterium CG_4_10_14_3_um_filter_53_41]PJA7360